MKHATTPTSALAPRRIRRTAGRALTFRLLAALGTIGVVLPAGCGGGPGKAVAPQPPEEVGTRPVEPLALAGGGNDVRAAALPPQEALPAVSMCGLKCPTRRVVYVIDRSGSMLDTFDRVRRELATSIRQLSAECAFHTIFFATGAPNENPPRRLVKATQESKRAALEHIGKIRVAGQTHVLPALQRAFKVLEGPDGGEPVGTIYLLTDGELPDNDKVVKRIRELNAKGGVKINTILWRYEDGARALKTIAEQNGGKYVFVPLAD